MPEAIKKEENIVNLQLFAGNEFIDFFMGLEYLLLNFLVFKLCLGLVQLQENRHTYARKSKGLVTLINITLHVIGHSYYIF